MSQQQAKVAEESQTVADDPEMQRIVGEEEKVLARVQRTIAAPRRAQRGQLIDYDAELIALRDQIREARLEDIPPLVEEMERLQMVAQRRAKVTEGMVDPLSPYFGRLVLEENDRKREVLIGRSTFLDSKTGVRIVDWRDAPVSRVYYRYEEGDDYDEVFGDRLVEGEVLVRRSVSITHSNLKRIATPQGTFRKSRDGDWRRAGQSATRLSGGQGAAMRPEGHHRPGQLGIGGDDEREDKHLAEITALIDPRQFDLISKPTSGLVVIQGGAGSGKTTIGLHRLAYLAFQDRERFRADKMLVVVFNDALVRYISRVLPALGVNNTDVVTFESWAARMRRRHVRHLPKEYAEDTPSHITRFKKHPALLNVIDAYCEALAAKVDTEIQDAAKRTEGGARVIRVWNALSGQAPVERMMTLQRWMRSNDEDAKSVPLESRHGVERQIGRHAEICRDVVSAWADILTDRGRLEEAFGRLAPDLLSEREFEWVHSWCARRCTEILTHYEESLEEQDNERTDDADLGVDGQEERQPATLDREDDALFLRLHQRLVGQLRGRHGPLNYEHVFVDEAQDMSPTELAVVVDTVTEQQSITLAGDVAQRLYMDNGFSDWRSVLKDLGLEHVEIEPLKLSYRSTLQILEFATDVLGPLKNEVSGEATRTGAPVELFSFGSSGEAVGFLSEALRNLAGSEPLASVAVVARYPEQADLYYKGLVQGEVPRLRRVAEQDFTFKPGVDVTDVRQVKGLEFDYVVVVECTSATFPPQDEARHLLHIAATRAAHQLWVLSTGTASPILPDKMHQSST